MHKSSKTTNSAYKKAGVSLERADQVVKLAKKMTAQTITKSVVGKIGGFASIVSLGSNKLQDPLLVTTTDGVGTKLLVAIKAQNASTVGLDLVAMNLNDLITTGAKPVGFLDYIALAKINPVLVEQILTGVTKALRLSDTPLLGGETAEMPGMYKAGHYDLAGFAVGMVDRSHFIDGPNRIKKDDVILALPSNGLHANGFSLVRNILFERHNFSLTEKVPFTDQSVAQVLLKPTRLYVEPVLKLVKTVRVHGLAHITGGGLCGNIVRVLPKNLTCKIKQEQIRVLPVFKWLQKLGKTTTDEMFKTFNMGVGMVAIVNQQDVQETILCLKKYGVDAYPVGRIIPK